MAKAQSIDKPILVLFRTDLRMADNRALSAAAATGRPVIPVFIFDEESEGVRPVGGARRWWLHQSLSALGHRMAALGAPLLLRRGPMLEQTLAMLEETGADMVLWNRRYDPPEASIDAEMNTALGKTGIRTLDFDGHLLHDPSLLKTGSGGPYKVYSPFWRALIAEAEPRDPVDAPSQLRPFAKALASDSLDDWALMPVKPDWSGGFRSAWTPGEDGAQARLRDFLDGPVSGYGESRDIPGAQGTSSLSPHLANGEITPFQIFSALKSGKIDAPSHDLEKFRKEVGWREFAYHLLFHNPDLRNANFNDRFDDFPWKPDADLLRRWQRGQTGYPIVDGGMRQLWQTGWMHNRVRMIVASFLVKHLLIDWREGEKWFWDTLVDADPANNPASWQWVAGSGADAAPYFRIFNPILQGEKFDPDGTYVRRYVPELKHLPARYIHKPWESPKAELEQARVKLGDNYPVTVIEHQNARKRALLAYKAI